MLPGPSRWPIERASNPNSVRKTTLDGSLNEGDAVDILVAPNHEFNVAREREKTTAGASI
jgi:hypothetical protein